MEKQIRGKTCSIMGSCSLLQPSTEDRAPHTFSTAATNGTAADCSKSVVRLNHAKWAKASQVMDGCCLLAKVDLQASSLLSLLGSAERQILGDRPLFIPFLNIRIISFHHLIMKYA